MLSMSFWFVVLLGVGVEEAVSKTLVKRGIKCFHQTVASGDSDEIVGGDVVDIKQYPYQVSVLLNRRPHCGGSIISEDYVLTAAHCAKHSDVNLYQLQVGSSKVKGDGKLHNVEKLFVHPKYPLGNYNWDIAVIKSSTKIILDGITTKAVRLPASTDSLKPEDNLIITGWGDIQQGGPSSDDLRAVTIPVTTKEYCQDAYTSFNVTITEEMICAGLKEGGKDSCQGDSGGPAVYEKDLVQYGIVSFGAGCARPGIAGVYSYIPPLRDWIKEVSGV